MFTAEPFSAIFLSFKTFSPIEWSGMKYTDESQRPFFDDDFGEGLPHERGRLNPKRKR